jgi:hypothetical protein
MYEVRQRRVDTATDSVLPNDVAKDLNQLSFWLGRGRVMPKSNSLVLGTFEDDLHVCERLSTVCSCCRCIAR